MTPMNARSPVVIGTLVVVVLVGLGVFLLSRTGSGAPPAAAPAPQPSATPSITAGTPTAAPAPEDVRNQPGTTVLKVKVSGCPGCQVTAVPDDTTTADGPFAATVTNGLAQLEVPSPSTLGLSFFLQGEKDGNDTPARTLVILQPDRVAPGDAVTEAAAGSAQSAGYCWAGTTLTVATVRFSAQAKGGTVQSAWADPALPTTAAQVTPGGEKDFTPRCGGVS